MVIKTNIKLIDFFFFRDTLYITINIDLLMVLKTNIKLIDFFFFGIHCILLLIFNNIKD